MPRSLSIRNRFKVGWLSTARNIMPCFGDEVAGGLRGKYIIYKVAVRVKGTMQRFNRRTTKEGSVSDRHRGIVT